MTPTRIFVSYDPKDRSFARRLTRSLEDVGVDVWIDLDDIPSGTKASRAVQDGLQSSDLLIVVITPDSMRSNEVEDEWQYFLDRGKPVVPVHLKPTDIHFQLSRIQYIEFHNRNYVASLRELFGELRRLGAQMNVPPELDMPLPSLPDDLSVTRLARSNETTQTSSGGRGSRLAIVLLLLIVIGGGAAGAILLLTGGLPGVSVADAGTATPSVTPPTVTVSPSPSTLTPTPTPTQTVTATVTEEPTPNPEQDVVPTSDVPMVTAISAANVRGADNPNAFLTGFMVVGDTGVALGKNERGDWWYIEYEDRDSERTERGWVFANLVSETGDFDALPILDSTDTTTIIPDDE